MTITQDQITEINEVGADLICCFCNHKGLFYLNVASATDEYGDSICGHDILMKCPKCGMTPLSIHKEDYFGWDEE